MIPVEVDLQWRGKRYNDIDRGLRAFAEDVEADVTKTYGPAIRSLLRKYMEGVIESVRQRAGAPWPGGTSPAGQTPGTLSRRSGGLLKTLSPSRITIKGDASSDIEVSFKLSGKAAVHEKGATITPTRSKYLTIPLASALDSRGVPLRPSARDWQNTFVFKSKKGNLLIGMKQGGNLVPLYVLKRSVTIPPRLSFKEAFTSGKDFLADAIAQEVMKEFRRG